MALQLLVSGIAMGFVHALTVVEYTLIWNSSGLLSFEYEKIIMLGAYIFAGTMMLNLGTGMVPGVVVTLTLMVLSGMVIAFTIFIPLRYMSRLCAIMATIMMGNIINEAVRLYYGPEVMIVKGFMSGTSRLGGLVVAEVHPYIILISVVIVAVLELFTGKTKIEKAMHYVASNKTVAALMDVNVQQNMAITVAVNFAICGALGMPVIPVFSVNSSMVTMISLKGFAVGVVGGFGSLPGAIVGGLTLGIAENTAGVVFPSILKNVVAFVVLTTVLLVKPSGFPGKKRQEGGYGVNQVKITSNKIKKYRFVLVVIGALLLPQTVTNTYYVTMLCPALIYIIIAFGLNFTTGMTSQMNLGTVGIHCLGAYTSALLTTKTGTSPWPAMITVIAVGFLISIGLGYPSFRLEGVHLSLMTIAFSEVVRQLANNMTNFIGGAQGVGNIPPYTILGYAVTSKVQNHYFILAFVILSAIITYRIMHPEQGRAFIAIKGNIDAVETCGINTAKTKIVAFILASVFGCVAGGLYVHYPTYINASTLTLSLSVSFVVTIMVGGMGNMWGRILGAITVSMLLELLHFFGEYYQITYSMIILLCVIFMPGGIINTTNKKQK